MKMEISYPTTKQNFGTIDKNDYTQFSKFMELRQNYKNTLKKNFHINPNQILAECDIPLPSSQISSSVDYEQLNTSKYKIVPKIKVIDSGGQLSRRILLLPISRVILKLKSSEKRGMY